MDGPVGAAALSDSTVQLKENVYALMKKKPIKHRFLIFCEIAVDVKDLGFSMCMQNQLPLQQLRHSSWSLELHATFLLCCPLTCIPGRRKQAQRYTPLSFGS